MSSEYNYDADAQFFPFFLLTITSLVTIPLTYTLLRKPSDNSSTSSKTGNIASSYEPRNADIINNARSKQKRKELRLKRMLTAATGWLVMAYMVYLMIVTARNAPKIWDPYGILEVSMSATEKQISSRYRKLSTTMHPDKRRPNKALNETAESVNDQWVDIVKAYKSLTDEDVRNNYLQYGNPDGKQSTSFGIALPSWLIAEGSGKYIMILYGLLLGIGLPWLVGKWWYGMQKLTREKVLAESAGYMFKEYQERMDPGDVVAAASSAMEFKEILNGVRAHSGLDTLEETLQTSDIAENDMLPKDQKKLNDLDDPVRRKTLALVWAYLQRLDLSDKTLELEKYEIAPTALQMNEAFLSICLAYGNISPALSSFHLSQSLVQAIPPHHRLPLLQLPHISRTIAEQVEQRALGGTKQHMSVQSFMSLPAEQRRAIAEAAGLTSDRLTVAETVARQLPLLKVEKAWFKVQGEKFIIPSSLVQFVVKARFIPPGTANVPPVSEKDLEDIDPAEGDLQAQKQEQEQHYPPLAYAPYFARDRSPKWHIFLADNRQGKIAVPPFTFVSFDKKPFEDDGKGGLKPTFNVVTLKMQFQAPPQPGEFKFQMQMLCDSYVGFDHKQEAIMVVHEATKALAVDDDDDISEPEEDSIAGAMATLKGQPTADPDKPRVARKKAQKVDEESDYESGTDEDEDEESDTDTDTDTDGE